MQDYFTLETIPGTKKKLRVYWEDGESQGESDHRPWDHDKYVMTGIGEDGSEWEHWGEYHTNSDEFYGTDDPEITKDPGSFKSLTYWNIHDKNPGYWDMTGRIPNKANDYKSIPIKEYFKLRVGDYPNVNISKGPDDIKLNSTLNKDPRRFHQSIVGGIGWSEMQKINVDKNKHTSRKYTYGWDEEKQTDIIKATAYGIVYDILSSNNYNFLMKLNYLQINGNGNSRRDIMNAIVKHLL